MTLQNADIQLSQNIRKTNIKFTKNVDFDLS